MSTNNEIMFDFVDTIPKKEEEEKEKKETKNKKQEKISIENIKELPERYKFQNPIRQTYHIEKELVEKVKLYAYIKRLRISEVVNIALKQYLKD